ncbi:MAG TPA: sulfite exporter TauE/SafE family protein [Saprospiraceae bacterium]|nr:sulfite exporter TauE/SafE family protein [Saprospiraceae bacterium]
MWEVLEQMNISWTWWLLAIIGSFSLGIAKGGIKGLGAIITTFFAIAFGSKSSTGIVMPLLIVGDVFAVVYYHRHARWSYLRRLLPWMIGGVLIGVWYGRDLPEADFKKGMALLILISVALMWILDSVRRIQIPDNGLFAAVMGTVSGFSTMVGNLAGPFSELYFLAIRMPKEIFIGTAAWLFFLVNLFKLPFHIFSWHTISPGSLYVDLALLPAEIFGLWAGVVLVRRLNQDHFRKSIMILTTLGSLLIFLQ